MATILTEDFNTLNDGNINGQNGWSVAGGTGTIQGTTVYEGAKALTISAAGGDIRKTQLERLVLLLFM
jgi:hypothetical protein